MGTLISKPCGCAPDQTCRECRDLPQPLPQPLGIPAGGPFDPRIEVSADARYVSGRIVKHLWIIFVLLPVALAIVYEMVK